jgi:hypothetical protein
MRIVGIEDPMLISRLKSSTPVILGIWISAIRQAVALNFEEARKSKADGNEATE